MRFRRLLPIIAMYIDAALFTAVIAIFAVIAGMAGMTRIRANALASQRRTSDTQEENCYQAYI
jgi:hypothetical protein